MATSRPFDRRVISVRQRPLSEDHNLMFSVLQEQFRRFAFTEFSQRNSVLAQGPTDAITAAFLGGFAGGSFFVQPDTGMNVTMLGGYDVYGFSAASVTGAADVGGNVGVNVTDAPPSPLVLSAEQTLTVPAAPSVGSSRIDLIEVRPEYSLVDTTPTSIWDFILRRFTTQNVPRTFTWDLDGLTGTVNAPAASTAAISYKKGVEAVGAIAAATEPTVTSGYTPVARINVVGGTTAITAAMIADLRPPLLPAGLCRIRADVTIGSSTGGMGSEAIRAVYAPPGVWCRMVDTASYAGGSRVYTLYVFGVRAPALGTLNARLTGQSPIVAVSQIVVSAGAGTEGRVTSAIRTTLNSGASIGGAVDVAEGTPYVKFDVFAETVTKVTAQLPAAAFPLVLDITIAQAL